LKPILTENSKFDSLGILPGSVLSNQRVFSGVASGCVKNGEICVVIDIVDFDSLGVGERDVVSPDPRKGWWRFTSDVDLPFVGSASLNNDALEVGTVNNRFD